MSQQNLLNGYAEEFLGICPFKIVQPVDGKKYYRDNSHHELGYFFDSDIGVLSDGKLDFSLNAAAITDTIIIRAKQRLFEVTVIAMSQCLEQLAQKRKAAHKTKVATFSDLADLFKDVPTGISPESRLLGPLSWTTHLHRGDFRKELAPLPVEEKKTFSSSAIAFGAPIISIPRKGISKVLTYGFETSLVVTAPTFTLTGKGVIEIRFGYDIQRDDEFSVFEV